MIRVQRFITDNTRTTSWAHTKAVLNLFCQANTRVGFGKTSALYLGMTVCAKGNWRLCLRDHLSKARHSMLGKFLNPGSDSTSRPADTGDRLQPDRPFYAIGDVHGCMDQMQAALVKVDTDIETHQIEDPAVVFLGDYVDRGRKSAEVLRFLHILCENEPDAVICLKGNHEQMLLNFIDDPTKNGKSWLHHGGADTLDSFGIAPPDGDAEALYTAAEELAEALSDGILNWLRGLPLQWHSGNLHCVHAAMDPVKAPGDQHPDTLLWGDESFLKTARADGNWIVHGHTVVDAPNAKDSRISLDTGCYFTGTLTAAAFTNGTLRIL